MKNILVMIGVVLGLQIALADGHKVGESAPFFKAKNQDGKLIDMKDYFGKKAVLLYFYPKDDTPGCTSEACHFRDEFESLKAKGLVIFGVSKQDQESHKEFQKKYHIPFDLLVDTDGAVSKAFGIGSYPLVGLLKRQSVLVGKDGKVVKFYEDVDPETHTKQVTEDLKSATK